MVQNAQKENSFCFPFFIKLLPLKAERSEVLFLISEWET
jgi:hypothetical protein